MRLMRRYSLGLLAVISSVMVSAKGIPEWQIVPSESQITFTATQNGAPVTGSFKSFTGDIHVDPENYKTSTIHIIVDINSLTTSYSDLIETLTSEDWFNAKMFPKADFSATKFSKLSNKTYKADGELTIRDKSAPVTLIFTAVESPENHGVIEGQTVIKRSTFGVGQGEWASTDEVKDDVTVNFKVGAVIKKAKK